MLVKDEGNHQHLEKSPKYPRKNLYRVETFHLCVYTSLVLTGNDALERYKTAGHQWGHRKARTQENGTWQQVGGVDRRAGERTTWRERRGGTTDGPEVRVCSWWATSWRSGDKGRKWMTWDRRRFT